MGDGRGDEACGGGFQCLLAFICFISSFLSSYDAVNLSFGRKELSFFSLIPFFTFGFFFLD